MSQSPIIVYHAINPVMACDDGFAAAWVAWKRFKGDAVFVPGIYGQPPLPLSAVEGRQVYFLDFSLKRPEMLAIGRAAAQLTVIDHHLTAREELSGLVDELMADGWPDDGMGQPLNAPHVVFDMDHSGAVLAWRHFFANGFGPPPDLLLRIEDGDLWRWAYPDSKLVQAALRSYPHDFETWDRLMQVPIARLAEEGVAIRRFLDAKVRELLPNARNVFVDRYEVPAIACPKFLASELAGALAEKYPAAPFGVAYEDGERHRSYSLRSRGDFDVSEVAKRRGGGGHRNAAGFEVPLP